MNWKQILRRQCNIFFVKLHIGIAASVLTPFLQGKMKFLYNDIYNIYIEGKKKDLQNKRKIVIIKEGKKQIFNNLSELAKFLDVSRNTIYYHIDNKKQLKGYLICKK